MLCLLCSVSYGMHHGTCLQVKGKVYPVDVYSVAPPAQ